MQKFEEINICVYGTYKEALLKASDIGQLLGISKIRDSMEK